MAEQKSIHCHETQHIIRMVAYFAIFQHPLRMVELAQLTGSSHANILKVVQTNANILSASDSYVWLKNNEPEWTKIQVKRDRAIEHWPQALRYGRHLSKMPFVKGVFLTGSMSKGAVSEDSDFDYLLVVETGRVWLVKTLLELLRKSMTQYRRECYCANYIVGLDALRLQHRNVFTAVELSTAIPLFGSEACTAFIEANAWSEQFVPNQKFVRERADLVPSISILNQDNSILDHLDVQAMRIWDLYWEKKYVQLAAETRKKRFRREPGKAANHLHDFQDRVISALEDSLKSLGFNESLIL